MTRSAKVNDKIKSVLILSVFGIITGFLFTVFVFGFDLVRSIKGITAGFIITFLIGVFENFIFRNNFRKLKFSVGLLIRTFIYVLIITFAVVLVWIIHESSLNNTGLLTTFKSDDFKHFIFEGDFKGILVFAVFFSFLVNLFTQINNLLGKNVLKNYVLGRYHQPKEEERTFMFLDLTSSTAIAEKLGPVVYHKFINKYYFDIDEAIIESGGEVHQYVGDEVVISWKHQNGFKEANCIRCFFRIKEKIDSLSEVYKKEFGIVPGFKAGLHYGQVITGEIGDSKKEIAFHGDVLNTTARIMSECKPLNKIFLVSEDILNNISLPDEYETEPLGEFSLRGKEKKINLYSIRIK